MSARTSPARAGGTPVLRPAPDPADDEGLGASLRAALAGDPEGFGELYRSLQPRLHRYARALVGQDADDVTAEAWLQIARDLGGFRGDVDGFRGWTASITRHRALDLLKARSRRPADAAGLQVVPDLADRSATGHPADAALETLSTQRAVALIATLPRHQAEAVLLRAVVGLSADAAGAVLGKRAGAVRVAAHRGLQSLAHRLRGERDARVPADGGVPEADGGDGWAGGDAW